MKIFNFTMTLATTQWSAAWVNRMITTLEILFLTLLQELHWSQPYYGLRRVAVYCYW